MRGSGCHSQRWVQYRAVGNNPSDFFPAAAAAAAAVSGFRQVPRLMISSAAHVRRRQNNSAHSNSNVNRRRPSTPRTCRNHASILSCIINFDLTSASTYNVDSKLRSLPTYPSYIGTTQRRKYEKACRWSLASLLLAAVFIANSTQHLLPYLRHYIAGFSSSL